LKKRKDKFAEIFLHKFPFEDGSWVEFIVC